MTEQDRIDSIKNNVGCHLKNFKDENKTYDMCLVAVSLDKLISLAPSAESYLIRYLEQ